MPVLVNPPKKDELPIGTSWPGSDKTGAPQGAQRPTQTLVPPPVKPTTPPPPASLAPQGPSAASGFGDASSLTPQTAGQAGTGYVNLSRVLGANLGAGQNVDAASQKKLTTELGNRNAAQKAYTDKRSGAVANSSLASGAFMAPDMLSNALENPDKSDLQKGLRGLDVEKFSRGTSGEMNDLNALGNGATAGRVLAKDAGVTGGYLPKLSALDSLIYGGNSAAAGSVAGAKTAGANETKNAAAAAGAINSETARLNKVATDTAAANANTLRGVVGQYGDIAKGEADAVNKANAGLNPQDYADMAAGLSDVPLANAGQFVNPGMERNSQTIAQLLGDPSLAMTGTGKYNSKAADTLRQMAEWKKEIQGNTAAPDNDPEPYNPSRYDLEMLANPTRNPGGGGGGIFSDENKKKIKAIEEATQKHKEWADRQSRKHLGGGNTGVIR